MRRMTHSHDGAWPSAPLQAKKNWAKGPETYCADNIKSLAMVFGAIESSETGERVEIGTEWT
jgi:hypothetical protein